MASASASLISLGRKNDTNLMIVSFLHCSGFDTMMFKNNVFDWLFSNTLGNYQLSDDSRGGFMVRLDENRDVKNFVKFFPQISFETTVKV